MSKLIAWSQKDAKIRNGIFLLSMLAHALTIAVMVTLAVSK